MRIALENGWTGRAYSGFRVIFGVYLALHFAQLLPWGRELFSSEGMIPEAALSPLFPLFPNVLFVFDSPTFVSVLLGIAVAFSVTFIIGWHDRVAALVIWYVWACILNRNPLISNPGIPFVGWMLIAHACLPRGPAGSVDGWRRSDLAENWSYPAPLFATAWIVMSIGYSYSGWCKLLSPSWVDGTAVAHILANPLARPGVVRDLFLALPDVLIQLGSWGGVALELLFAPLAVLSRLRPLLWVSIVLMHLSLMALIDFPDLSQGMLLLHAFTFDPAWLRDFRGAAAKIRGTFQAGT
jgi:hypothetical protein